MFNYLRENNEDVLFVDRTGNIIAVYCKGNIKVLFEFSTQNIAKNKYREFRRELEGIKV